MILVRLRLFGFALSLFAAFSSTARADFLAVQNGGSLIPGNSLSGEVTYERWTNLNTTSTPNPNATGGPTPGPNSTRPYGTHGSTAGWYNWVWDEVSGTYISASPATIAANLGSGTSTVWKSSGYGYLSGSIHQGFPGYDIVAGGNFTMRMDAIAGLETLVFQIEATDRGGSATELGVVFSQLPTLTIGSMTLSADYQALVDAQMNYSSGGFGVQNMQYWAFQWDLRDLSIEEGADFAINWTGVTNSGIFGLQVNQGDTFAQVVPEPSTYAMIALGLAIVAWKARRRIEARQ